MGSFSIRGAKNDDERGVTRKPTWRSSSSPGLALSCLLAFTAVWNLAPGMTEDLLWPKCRLWQRDFGMSRGSGMCPASEVVCVIVS